MALPEFWLGLNRKDLAERALVSKRDQQAQLIQRCESAAKYHRELNLLSTQYKNLENNASNKIPKVNRESRHDEELRARQKECLQSRQQRLTVLLAKENEIFLAELKTLSGQEKDTDPWSIVKLKEQIEELRLRRLQHEEMLKKSNYHKMMHETKIPYLKEFEERLSNKDMAHSVQVKKQEFEKKASDKIAQDNQKKEELKMALKTTREEIKAIKIERLQIINKWEAELKKLIQEIEDCKPQITKLDLQISSYKSYADAVKGILKKREDLQHIQEERINKIMQFRPSREKVLRMASEVKVRLDLDLKSLEFLSEFLKKGEDLITVDLTKIDNATKSIAEKLIQHTKENSDLQVLFEEEISKLWKEKKKVWDEELEVHDKFVKNLLTLLVNEMREKEQACVTRTKELYQLKSELFNRLSEYKEKSKEEDRTLVEKEDYFVSKAQDLERSLVKFETRPVTADTSSKARTNWKPFM